MKTKLLGCFLLLIISSTIYAQFDDCIELEFNTNLAAGTTITLPIDGAYDVEIMWDVSTPEFSPVNSDADLTHTYASEGNYTVVILGTVPHFGNTNSWTGANMLIEVNHFEPPGLTSLSGAFAGAVNLRGLGLDIPSTVTDLSYLCYGASSLEGFDLSGDLSNVTDMSYMCYGTSSLATVTLIGTTSNVTNMSYMFAYSNSFAGYIGNWDVSGVTDMTGMFKGTKLEEITYSDLLNGWSKQTLQQNVTLDAGSSCYTMAEEANRQKIIDTYNWTILDGGTKEMRLYIETTSSDNNVTLPLYGSDIYVWIDWSLGYSGDEEMIQSEGKHFHRYTYWGSGKYDIIIDGTLPRFGLLGVVIGEKLKSVLSFGDLKTTSFGGAFYNAVNLESVPLSVPATVTQMDYMFYGADNFNQDLSAWDVSNVNNMQYMFAETDKFNGDISGWDVSGVSIMVSMFENAAAFNNQIGSWDVSSVYNMTGMFQGAVSFNQDISAWDVGNVSGFIDMFRGASAFNQNIGTWKLSYTSGKNMEGMFRDAVLFNQDISGWDVSDAIYMNYMFAGALKFNQDISAWDVADVHSMAHMFDGAASFDQDLSSWQLTSVTDMSDMFKDVTLSTENYSSMLIEWSKQTLQNNVTFSGGNSKYNSEAAVARQSIIDNYGWSISDGGEAALPVQLTLFDGEFLDGKIELNWETATEINNYGFDIERKHQLINDESKNAGEWVTIGFVKGNGTCNSTHTYSFTDNNVPQADKISYRLKQIDNNGNFEYSKIITIDPSEVTDIDEQTIPEEFSLSQNYPNPFNPVTQINYQIAKNSNVSLKVYNILGKEVATLINKTQAPGYYNVEFNGADLASGIYLYQLKAGEFIQTKKLMLVK